MNIQFRKLLWTIVVILILGIAVWQIFNLNKDKPVPNLPNPASVNCKETGGELDIRSEPKGQYGVCKFNDGTECEEWAYFRGTCKPGQYKIWEPGEGESE